MVLFGCRCGVVITVTTKKCRRNVGLALKMRATGGEGGKGGGHRRHGHVREAKMGP